VRLDGCGASGGSQGMRKEGTRTAKGMQWGLTEGQTQRVREWRR